MRIFIVDDHAMVRRGLRTLVESHPECEVCGEASGGLEAVTKARELLPDVVIMDVSMPRTSGLEATRQIVEALPGVAVLIVTVHDSMQMISAARNAGASGYLLKTDVNARLFDALNALSRHEPYFPPAPATDETKGSGG